MKTAPTTTAGRALAAWGRRTKAMTETIARIEEEAIDDYLGSESFERDLADALGQSSDPFEVAQRLRRPRS